MLVLIFLLIVAFAFSVVFWLRKFRTPSVKETAESQRALCLSYLRAHKPNSPAARYYDNGPLIWKRKR